MVPTVEREVRTGATRTKVVPVTFDHSPPLALGLVMAYAMRWTLRIDNT